MPRGGKDNFRWRGVSEHARGCTFARGGAVGPASCRAPFSDFSMYDITVHAVSLIRDSGLLRLVLSQNFS